MGKTQQALPTILTCLFPVKVSKFNYELNKINFIIKNIGLKWHKNKVSLFYTQCLFLLEQRFRLIINGNIHPYTGKRAKYKDH